ncbi:MAG: hypothetical protein KAT32_03215 [Candidatus Moranbacteria bacterium]|nr:hypothetical protein [Candidatus Moranbacteria bacterium]
MTVQTQIYSVLKNDGLIAFKNYLFPTADGTVNQVLKTDGTGTLTWQDESVPVGDLDFADGDFLVFDKAVGNGIKIDTTTPDFGWRDLTGPIIPKAGGGTAPAFTAFRGTNIKSYAFQSSDVIDNITFHLPHDYVPGTDIYTLIGDIMEQQLVVIL